MNEYARTLAELKEKAVLFWPTELLERETAVSILPLLLSTQDKFISVLNLSDAGPESWKKFVDVSTEMKGNLFLKHLMVLSDLGGEALSKLTPLDRFFPAGQMVYFWRKTRHTYLFKALQGRATLNNTVLRVDGKSLHRGFSLSPKMEDIIMLLLHGDSSIEDTLPEDVKNKCMIGSLIGDTEGLGKFVRQNYIRISRQLAGATSNALGQLAQDYVIEHLEKELPAWSFKRNGHIPGISHNAGNTETSFDVVAISPNGKYFGVEITFQFTTNSVIERKSGQAKARQDLLHANSHHICYVIDGAGNIDVRESAVRTICQFSDCTVAFSPEEFRVLARFLKESAGNQAKGFYHGTLE